MANKTFVVQYLIKAREQFAEAADKTRVATRKMRQEMEKAKRTFAQTAAQMRKTGALMTAGITAPIALVGLSLKNAARDAEETRSKFGTVFKGISGEANAAAQSLATNYGLASTKSMELLGNTGDLLTGFGFTQEKALELATGVNELAVDLASFTNFSGGAEGASAALTKALLGERESIKSLGISILETDVKRKVSQMLAEGHTFASLRQAKAQATLVLAMEQSKNAIGDFARTQHQLANQERILGSRLQDLKEAFGRILLPVALKITQAMKGVVEAMLDLSPGTKKAILIVAGLAAAIGPLLLALGSMAFLWPALAAGAAVFGAIASTALASVGIMLSPLGIALALILVFWDEISAFFQGFAAGISSTFGPTLSKMAGDFMKAGKVIASMFGDGGEANESMAQFANMGEFVGRVIGETLSLLINGLSGIGAILGQVIAAAVTMDFSNFDVDAIKAEFMGTTAEPAVAKSTVDVGVNVGLAKGLEQLGPAEVAGSGARRADVGVN